MAKLEQRIRALLDSDAAATLAGIRRGIEKESLRIPPMAPSPRLLTHRRWAPP